MEKHRCNPYTLTLEAPITTAADDIHKYFFIIFPEKIRLNVSSESSARIHMKNQVLFSSKDKSKKFKCCLLQFLFGVLLVKVSKTYSMPLQTVLTPLKLTFSLCRSILW